MSAPSAATERPPADPVKARDIGSKGGDRDATFEPADNLLEAVTHAGLGSGLSGNESVGRITDERQNSLLTQSFQRIVIGLVAEERFRIELPVAGVNDGPERRRDGKCVGLGNGMGDGNKNDRKGTKLDASAQRNGRDADALAKTCFLELAFDQTRRERSGVEVATQ